jgi:CDP-diacylglycerol--glycerol-3-phosphate 3-phosphatidyltransferase
MVTKEKKDKAVLNLANGLSVARMLLAPVFMIVVFKGMYAQGVIIILIATLTDFLDGHIARIWNMQTRLGKMLDPLADKVIIIFAILTLLIKLNFPIWIGLIIISRDLILLTGSIIFLYKHKRKTLNPNMLGKISTFFQMSTVVLYAFNVYNIVTINILTIIFLFFTVIFTLASATVYFVKGYSLFFKKKKKIRINLANRITITRIIAIPIFIVFLLSNIPLKEIIAAILFSIIAMTDALDGYIARKRRQITDFGKLIDPLADKLLVSAALIFLVGKGISAWIAYTIIAREFVVTGLRMIAVTKHQTLEARKSGKIKTVIQVIAIIAVLLKFQFAPHLMIVAVIITIYSGLEYLWEFRHLVKELS